MAESDGTTTGVELLLGHSQLSHAVGSLTGEGLVDFENINLVLGKASLLQGGGDSESGSNSHNSGRHTSDGEADKAANDLAAELVGNISSSEQNAGSTISNLTGVTGSGGATLLESGLQLGEALEGGSGSSSIISVNKNFLLVAILVLNNGGVGSDFRLGPSHLLGMSSLGVTINSELILSLTVDTELSSDILGSDTHRHEASLSLLVLVDGRGKKVGVDGVHHGAIAHGLNTSTNSNSDFTGLDGVSNSSDGLESGGAETVDALNASGLGVASEEHTHTGSGGTSTALEHVADNDILNLGLVNSSLLGDSIEDGSEHSFGTSVLLGSLLSSSHGSSSQTNDDNVVVSLGANSLSIEVCVVFELRVQVLKSLHFEIEVFSLRYIIIKSDDVERLNYSLRPRYSPRPCLSNFALSFSFLSFPKI